MLLVGVFSLEETIDYKRYTEELHGRITALRLLDSEYNITFLISNGGVIKELGEYYEDLLERNIQKSILFMLKILKRTFLKEKIFKI